MAASLGTKIKRPAQKAQKGTASTKCVQSLQSCNLPATLVLSQASADSLHVGKASVASQDKPKSAAPPLTPSGNPLSEWTLDNRKELAAFMVDPQKDDLFDESELTCSACTCQLRTSGMACQSNEENGQTLLYALRLEVR